MRRRTTMKTNTQIREYFWAQVASFDVGEDVDVNAMVRVFSVEHPDAIIDSAFDAEFAAFDRVRYLATEVAEMYRSGWRPAETVELIGFNPESLVPSVPDDALVPDEMGFEIIDTV
jgi:hypothetical protein